MTSVSCLFLVAFLLGCLSVVVVEGQAPPTEPPTEPPTTMMPTTTHRYHRRSRRNHYTRRSHNSRGYHYRDNSYGHYHYYRRPKPTTEDPCEEYYHYSGASQVSTGLGMVLVAGVCKYFML